MKALVYHGPGRKSWEDAPMPEIQADTDAVVRVDAVTGPYDVVVLTEARSVDELGKMIVSKVQLVPGITRTLTCSVVHL